MRNKLLTLTTDYECGVIHALQDGLVCVYDITNLNEDDAIMSVLNTESSVVSHIMCALYLESW